MFVDFPSESFSDVVSCYRDIASRINQSTKLLSFEVNFDTSLCIFLMNRTNIVRRSRSLLLSLLILLIRSILSLSIRSESIRKLSVRNKSVWNLSIRNKAGLVLTIWNKSLDELCLWNKSVRYEFLLIESLLIRSLWSESLLCSIWSWKSWNESIRISWILSPAFLRHMSLISTSIASNRILLLILIRKASIWRLRC